jgi:hypothetical protein
MKVVDAIDDALGRFRCRPSRAMGKNGQYHTAPLWPESQCQPGAVVAAFGENSIGTGCNRDQRDLTMIAVTALSPMHPVSAQFDFELFEDFGTI